MQCFPAGEKNDLFMNVNTHVEAKLWAEELLVYEIWVLFLREICIEDPGVD